MSGTKGDFKIYQDELYTGMIEGIDQAISVLNETGSILLLTANTRGDFRKGSFFQNIDDLVSDRDVTSTSDVSASKITQGEIKDILHNYRVGPVSQSLDSFRKISQDPSLMSFIVGQQAAEKVAQSFLNKGLAALVAAMTTEAGMVFDNTTTANTALTGSAKASVRALNRAKALMGDNQAAVRLIVGPAAVANEMIDSQIEKLGDVSSNVVVYGGSPATLGLPFYMTDSPALSFDDSGTAKHNVLLLTDEALRIEQNDYLDVHSDVQVGKANLLATWQAESSVLFAVKGFSYTGTTSTGAALATPANWNYAFDSIKSGPGVLLVVAA